MVSESDAAFYSFSCVMLSLYIVPASIFTLYRILRTPKKIQSRSFTIQGVLLAVALALFWRCLQQLQSVDTSGVFDPYEILQIPETASSAEIRRVYRRLGKVLHPDKNLRNPEQAAAKFARVTKAYEALIDPIGMENYRKYGHPDGRQSLLMNFAVLSSFGSDGNSGALFVLVYFTLVIAVVAWIVYTLHKNSGRRDLTQVSKRTYAILIDKLQESMSVHDIVELLLSCDEMTTMEPKEVQLEAQYRAKAHEKILKKMEAAKGLPSEALTRIKKHPNHVARENIIALYFFLRRHKLQGVSKPAWVDDRMRKVLLAFPYLVEIFSTIAAEHSVKRRYQCVTLMRSLSLLSSMAQGSLVADEIALREQQSRLAGTDAILPELHISSASMTVLDEPNVQPGDWVTAQVQVERKHIQPGEKAPLAATFYDDIDKNSPIRKEHLWFLIIEKASNQLYAAWKVRSGVNSDCVDLSQEVKQKVGFWGPNIAGNYKFEIRVVSVAYLAVQASQNVSLQVETVKN